MSLIIEATPLQVQVQPSFPSVCKPSSSPVHRFSITEKEVTSNFQPFTRVSTDNDEDLSRFLNSIQRLLLKYTMYSRAGRTPVSSGGLQQFITQKLKRKAESSSLTLMQRLRSLYSNHSRSSVPTPSAENEEELSLLQCLPVDLKLYIFSFLDAKALCTVCCVNQEWSELACDELLWQRLLYQDIKTWSQISHLTNPQMYFDVNSEWSTKEIYLKCCPVVHQQFRQSNTTFNQVSSMLKYLLPKKTPKVAMFGPGLEQSTSGLVRKMIYEDNQMFTRVAMFPGQFEGVGGGMTLKLNSGHALHLSVLYSASKQERENRAGQDRMQHNKLLHQRQVLEGEEAEGGEPVYELQPQIKHLCQTLEAFIFVVDAGESAVAITEGREELMAMIGERMSAVHIPLLVLSCAENKDRPRIPACEVIDLLQLTSLSQPWMVIDCVTDTLESVDTGVIWLVNQAQQR